MKTSFCLVFFADVICQGILAFVSSKPFHPPLSFGGHKPFLNAPHSLSLPTFPPPKLGKQKARGPPPSFWTREIDDSTIRQKGFASNTPFDDRILVYTLPNNLPELGLTPSATLIDFSGDEPLSVVRVGKRCYLVPTEPGLTFEDAALDVILRNGTKVNETVAVELDLSAIDGLLTPQEVLGLVKTTPTVGTFCPGDIYLAIPDEIPPVGSVPPGQTVVAVVTLDSVFNILAPIGGSRRKAKRKLGGKSKHGFGGVIFR